MADRPLALVTGSSAGIGEALAREAAADGYDVLLVARRKDKLEALARDLPTTGHVLAVDLADPHVGDAVIDEVHKLGRHVDVLVNNAGFGASGGFLNFPREVQVGMVDVNIRVLVDLTYRLLPAMIEAKSGGVINLASTAAFQPGPRMAVYYASKSFVLSFTQALSFEAAPNGVTVTCVCPGPTVSEFAKVSRLDTNHLFKLMPKMTSADVARLGWKGFRAGKRVVVTGWGNRIAVMATKSTPNIIKYPIVSWLHSEPR